MKQNQFHKLLSFLDRLEKARVHYRLTKHLEEAISVEVYTPGAHWEVDFFADGDIYVETFRSEGKIESEAVLEELFALCSDEEPPLTKHPSQRDMTIPAKATVPANGRTQKKKQA